MMALPFFALFAGLGFAWRGKRCVAIGFWAATLILMLVLFRLHVTDPLPLDF